MSERPTQNEANSTYEQEVEEQEVLKLVDAIKEQVRYVSYLRCGYGTSDAIQSLDELVEMLVAKLREKDAKTIAGLQAAARFWNDRANEQSEEIAYLKAQLTEAQKYVVAGAIGKRGGFYEYPPFPQDSEIVYARGFLSNWYR